ncbi:23S rRNA (adenine(2503)-C(2))-methyltransferase RlmN [Clostridium frigidicarnis]|uniref:Probable dual-specificity RNA methyltransferase RlmN n=1 Tax=Clostridium frigidicarnis TaxID=84698 RepID=A0A1I0ZQU2_9CLOT|nr:23S rRNA (adenine(2503)-C(2))-methyltransferase RlmN [Clostridium frigidicarnis]SFB26830.1 23S rRNA m(2)A-2503 methyltransferase [Clostridium frigidicarnis]
MKNIYDLTLDELKLWMKENKESEFRSKQVIEWLYKDIKNFDDMKNLPKALKEKLNSNFTMELPKVEHEYTSRLDGTKKLLLALQDGNLIECVIMKYNHGNSICVSTQVGCRMGCKFCASTIDGRVRDLTAGEILLQVIVGQKVLGERISNIVLMGSGEPFDNYDNVIKFLKIVNADYGLNIGQRHITLSTCGIVPKIIDFADEDMQITLAISLHSTTDDRRKEIMPIANKYSIKEILDACKYYIDKTGRRVSFEYSLVKEVNDSLEDAKSLGKLLKGILCHVNLIPINEIKENSYKKTDSEEVKIFAKILKEYGVETTVRREMGSDINAACGQLRRSYMETQK